MSEPPKFSFGAPASTAASAGSSLFGTTTNTAGGLFGAAGSTSSAPFSFGNQGTATPTSSAGESKPPFSFGNLGNAGLATSNLGESKPPFSFGNMGAAPPATSSAGESKQPFSFGNMGNSAPSTSNAPNDKPPFGGTGENNAGGVFGQQSGTGNTGSTFNWGKKPDDEKAAGSASTPFSAFGNTLQTPAKTNPQTSSGPPQSSTLFGGASAGVTSPGLFGAAPSAQFGSTTPAPAPAPSGGLSFGGPSTTPAGPPPASNTLGASTGGGGLFKLGGQAGPASGGLFGAKPAPSSQVGTSALPALSQPAVGSGLFGAVQSNTPFGAKTGQQGASSVFSGLGKPAESSNTTNAQTTAATEQKTLFGMPPTSAAASSSAAAPSFFQAASTSSAPSLFSNPPATSASSGAAKVPFQFPSLGTPASSQPASTTAAPADGAAKSVFGGLGKPKASEALSTTSPATTFLGAGKTATSTSQPGPAASTAPNMSTIPQAPSGAGTAQLGASTAGPVPPSQSRLRNKTMDEILTRWASDLTKYTKEFKSHSEVVAEWDQLLVENMTKISKLYASAVTSEKQTASVEMQLAAVENQQNELDSWLSKYEAEVDDMLTKNGASQGELVGPDQERERTYKLAEKLGERLEDMGRDLESMIEEVNGANASLSKGTKADEPITQIVRILNSHLTQLQAIDQGTVALQAKVAAAQKTAQGMRHLNGGSNGNGGAAVDDFYRSYMGR